MTFITLQKIKDFILDVIAMAKLGVLTPNFSSG